jgi:hypothetical protein
MSTREPKLLQEIGPKKYKEKIRKASEFYDKYKAGKTDPKTGEYYNHFTSKPSGSKISSVSIGQLKCSTEGCNNFFSIKRTTCMVICSKCNKLNSISKQDIQNLQDLIVKEDQ